MGLHGGMEHAAGSIPRNQWASLSARLPFLPSCATSVCVQVVLSSYWPLGFRLCLKHVLWLGARPMFLLPPKG